MFLSVGVFQSQSHVQAHCSGFRELINDSRVFSHHLKPRAVGGEGTPLLSPEILPCKLANKAFGLLITDNVSVTLMFV